MSVPGRIKASCWANYGYHKTPPPPITPIRAPNSAFQSGHSDNPSAWPGRFERIRRVVSRRGGPGFKRPWA